MRASYVLGLCATLVACASQDAPSTSSTRALEHEEVGEAPEPTSVPSARSPTRAETEVANEVPQPEPAPVQTPVTRSRSEMQLDVRSADVPEGEDGRGNIVTAVDAIQIDVISPNGFGGRARDPVLHVGQLRFTRYGHPAPDRMRFWVADRAILPAGAEVTLVWGDDRTVLSRGLEVPQ